MIGVVLIDDHFDQFRPLPCTGITQHAFENSDKLASPASLDF